MTRANHARVAGAWCVAVAIGLPPAASKAPQRTESAAGAIAAPTGTLADAARGRDAARITGRYDAWFKKYTKRYFGPTTDWRLFKAQGVAESELNPAAVSRVGARGIMQLMPATFGTIATSRTWMTSVDAPEANIAAGILHDHDLWVLWAPKVTADEVPRFTFASYNAGEGTIFRASGVAAAAKLDPTRWENIAQVGPRVRNWRHTETVGYVRKIEATYRVLQASR
ncbi:MAG: transglycosylase SLT domain-containing protein [Gemmatimonadetes bacterium]|nr:transglycosylase SLT domain-containing protein [Gemmatimonadota bacterium]